MAAVKTANPRVGDPARENAAVDRAHDRIVVADENQRRLMQSMEPMKTGPTQGSEHLPIVTEPAFRLHVFGMLMNEFGVRAEYSTVNGGCDFRHVAGIEVPFWCRHLHEHGKLAWDHNETSRGSRQYEATAAVRKVMGKLLSEATSP